MNRNLTWVLCVIACAAVARQGQEFFFRDRDGSMKLTNASSWKATRDKDDPNRFSFSASAATGVLVGTFEGQRLTLRSKSIEGKARKRETKTELEEAKLKGGVTANSVRAPRAQGVPPQTVSVACETLDFDGGTMKMDLAGGVTVEQDDPATESKLVAKGPTGFVVLTPVEDKAAKGPVQEASLQGGVRIVLTSTRVVTERPPGKPAVRKKVAYQVVATASRMDFRLFREGRDYGSITLSGSVVVTGDDPILFGEMKGYQKVVITLDAEMQPVDVEAGEGRGTTTVSPKGGGR